MSNEPKVHFDAIYHRCDMSLRDTNGSYIISQFSQENYIAFIRSIKISYSRSEYIAPKGDQLMENATIKELAIELTVDITMLCDNIAGRGVYTNQLMRSCSSIGANAHEAKYAQSSADFISKLEIALKECYETEYWLELLSNQRY